MEETKKQTYMYLQSVFWQVVVLNNVQFVCLVQ
jgi:hypothetical protein